MKVGFLCYSRYVIFVAYLIKNIYHFQDECTIILSDSAQQFSRKFIENLKASGIWTEVILLEEQDKEVTYIEHQMDKILDQDIKCFYIANIMRCSCHYLTNKIEADVELILMDEGSAILNLTEEYKFWLRKGLPLQWKEFNFARLNKMRVFFPQITKNPMNIPIEFISLKQLFLIKTFDEVIRELNSLFDYQYKKLERRVVLIDTHISKTNEYSLEFEYYCANQLLGMLDRREIIVKSAPSDSMEYVLEKYGANEVKVYSENEIPFEVVYLNYIVHQNLPEMIISMPSTLIWNINMIHQELEIQNVAMVSLVGIVRDFNCNLDRKKKFWKEQLLYNSVFEQKYKVEIPSDWYTLLQILNSYKHLKQIKTEKDLFKEENDFLKKNYVEILGKRNKKNDHMQFSLKKQSAYTDILYKIICLKNSGTGLSDILAKQDIGEIVIYGTGITGKILYEEVKGTKIAINCFAQTEKGNCSIIDDKIVLEINELEENIDKTAVIIVTMPFLLEEIKEILLEKGIHNRVISIFDMINDWGKEEETL